MNINYLTLSMKTFFHIHIMVKLYLFFIITAVVHIFKVNLVEVQTILWMGFCETCFSKTQHKNRTQILPGIEKYTNAQSHTTYFCCMLGKHQSIFQNFIIFKKFKQRIVLSLNIEQIWQIFYMYKTRIFDQCK